MDWPKSKGQQTMFKRCYMMILLYGCLSTACDNNATNLKSRQSNQPSTQNIPTKERVDNDFNDFIKKFDTDSLFQISRTKFPLKIRWYDVENDKDSLIYTNRSNFEMIEFFVKKPTEQYDQWKQKTVINNSNTSATIEIRGIDNGIMVDYLFEKVEGAWMLIEIDDGST